MPRFFFHLHNDIEAPDEEGLELSDLEAARRGSDTLRARAGRRGGPLSAG